jgi:hypothetical protein
MCDRVPQHHDCQDFQNWFFEHNSISLNCTDQVPAENVAEDLRLFLNNITVDVKEQTEHGVLEAKCEWDSDTAECKGIPIKLRLDCTDCAIKAVPELLQKCCDQGVEIANGPIMENLRRQGLAPQLWMDGCHSPTLEMPWYPYFVAFANYTKYSEYTEQRADEKMRTSVTNNYCSKGVPENASLCVDHPWHIVNARNENCQRRLRGDSSSPGSCQASVEAEEPEQANVYLAVPDASGNFEEVEMVVIDNKVDVTSRSTTSTTTTSTNDTGSHIDSNDQHDDTGSSSNNDSESSSASGPSTPLVGVLAIVLAGWL